MSELLTGVELTKLARELGVDESELDFLTALSPERLGEVRTTVSDAMFTRYEPRVRRIAALAKLLPAPLTAKIAQHALGPVLSGRIASVMDSAEAARLATRLPQTFLTDLSIYLDPHRVEPIVRRLPDELVIAIGTALLARGDYLTLGRFVAVVSTEVALCVVEDASPTGLLQVALMTEEPTALEGIIADLAPERLAAVIQTAADEERQRESVALVTTLPEASRTRVMGCLEPIGSETLTSFVQAVAEHDAWPAILPTLAGIPRPLLSRLVNLPDLLDPALLDQVIAHAHRLDLAPTLVKLLLALDAPHVEALRETEQLADREVQTWLRETSEIAPTLVDAVLGKIRRG